jgi:hypothetical protein
MRAQRAKLGGNAARDATGGSVMRARLVRLVVSARVLARETPPMALMNARVPLIMKSCSPNNEESA